VVVRPRDEGGLGLFYPKDFIMSLKITLVSKIISDDFSHKWKDIVINQLRFPDFPTIAIESGLVAQDTYKFTADLLACYQEWKTEVAAAGSSSINHCVWENKLITDIGAKLWNEVLINKGIHYISDFLDTNNQILDYLGFLRRHNIRQNDVPASRYLVIKMAIRRFNCPSVIPRSVEVVNINLTLALLDSALPLKGKKIRTMMTSPTTPNDLSPLASWSLELGAQDMDWKAVLNRIYYRLSNNFKLLQFQYKLLMNISTCRYMRFKMSIDKTSPCCSLCNNNLETLFHIFLKCPITLNFIVLLNEFIRNKLDSNYSDPSGLYFITCYYNNTDIDYLNLCAKWYISRQFQHQNNLQWVGYVGWVKRLLIGEKRDLKERLEGLL
jgi:hypothetical protein